MRMYSFCVSGRCGDGDDTMAEGQSSRQRWVSAVQGYYAEGSAKTLNLFRNVVQDNAEQNVFV